MNKKLQQKEVFKIEFYFTDRQFKVIGIASTDGAGNVKMVDDHEVVEYESDGLITFTGTLMFDESTSQLNKAKAMAQLGNYIIYRRHDGSSACITILEITHDPINGTRQVKGEDGGLDLLNNVVSAVTLTTPQSFLYYWNLAMADTGISLRQNIFVNESRTLSYDSENTALERLRAIISDFGGGKFTLDFVFENMELQNIYMDIVADIGEEKDITLRVGRDVDNIVTTGNIYELATAVRPLGGTPEGSTTRVTLNNYSWIDPDGRFKLENGVMIDTKEAPVWSRLLSTSGGLYTRSITYDTLDKGNLASLAVQHLKTNSVPQVNYDVSVVNPPNNLELGDRIDVVDEHDELYLSGKVLTIDRSTAEGTTDLVLGDFRIKYSGLNPQLVQIANDFSKQFDESIPAQVITTPSKQFFVNGVGSIKIDVKVMKGDKDITSMFTQFRWKRYDANNVLDPTFNLTGKTITISAGTSSVYTYYCTVDY